VSAGLYHVRAPLVSTSPHGHSTTYDTITTVAAGGSITSALSLHPNRIDFDHSFGIGTRLQGRISRQQDGREVSK